MNTNETPLEEISLLKAVDTILNEINDSLTRNDDVLETVNENTDTNFNDAVEYLMGDVIKNFLDECFIKDMIFAVNSVYDNFYEVKSVQITTTPWPVIIPIMHNQARWNNDPSEGFPLRHFLL